MEVNTYTMITEIGISLLYGFLLGMDPPKVIHPTRQRISILFCLGTTLFSSLLYSKLGQHNLSLVGLGWAAIFLISAVIARHVFNPETRSYAPLVGISIFTGYLVGIGSLFPALVSTVTYQLLLATLPNVIEDWLYGVSGQDLHPFDRPVRLARHRYTWTTYIVCSVLFFCSFVVALFQLDQTISERFRLWTTPLLPAMQAATHLADAKILFPTCAVLIAAFWVKKRRSTLLPLLAMGAWCMAEGVTYVLKHLIGRPRPYLWHQPLVNAVQLAHFHWFSWDHSRDYIGFPSGHATAFFAVAWVFASLPESKPRIRFGVLLFAAVLAAGRITLDQHFAADVIASAAIGIISAQALIDAFQRRLEKQGARLLRLKGSL